MWQDLKNKLVAMLTADSLLENVYDYEVGDFSGDPVAVLIPSANESDYRTTAANRRVYAFKLQLLVKRAEPRTDKQAEDALTEVVDSVLDTFDKNYTLGTGSPGSALVLPTGYTMIRVQALPATWGYVERQDTYRIAEIIIKIEMDVNVTLIS
ncbi:MAG TPA: hypothetical protein VFX17_02125 [Patescibacteria group bacterium]|nr:hypothetical protein [Patescibacteria group bacterium]